MRRATAVVVLVLTATAWAATHVQAAWMSESKPIDVINWNQAELRGGLSAVRLIGTDVRGQSGEKIGEVANIIVSAKDRVESVIVRSGRLLWIGDIHYEVPWPVVTVGPDLEFVSVPPFEDRVPNFTLFQDDEPRTGPRAWRVTELIGDYVRLSDGTRYGVVDDLLFDRHGAVKAIVVTPDVGWGRYGRFAYPYYGFNYGYDPSAADYTLPYGENEIMNLLPFDYDATGILSPERRKRSVGAR